MFRKKDEEQLNSGSSAPRDETAYEDNWYRSLKALSERQDHEPSRSKDDTPVRTSAEDEAPAETSETDEAEEAPEPKARRVRS